MRSELSSVIAGQGGVSYRDGMLAFCLRLMTLIALAMMPLGVPAPAASVPSASSGHCSDRQEKAPSAPDANMHCAACTALPPLAPAASQSAAPAEPVQPAAAVGTFDSMELEIATPPPKHV